jgi:hypothetical protein
MTLARAGLYLLVVLVLAFEASVAALMLRPRVADDYRAFYIERSTDCFPLPISGRYRLGTAVSFLAGAPSAPATAIKVCGWTDPADTGTWSVGREARLRFRFAAAPADVLIGIDMLAFVAEGLPEQRVTVVVNGEELDTIRMGSLSTALKIFRIPRQLILDHWGYVDLAFRFPDAASPAALGLSNDQRLLAIRLQSVRLWYATAPAADGA